ncbi:SH3 domain-containing protein [Streptomyces acidicola]|uniref:SH3 domain-containing protein n=1 Tax=Streptomyces acidicola TaxID=2596892 RepID=A0A5N8WJ99_9ACTN|nr:SH3 domain-containing protein [Streptomyces acidicola]MPY47182.1 SH3 domain-containing protein [Streptomyces acidicola]MPY47321.1 SH3 domain-containing protein [Streptomyces acidicola]
MKNLRVVTALASAVLIGASGLVAAGPAQAATAQQAVAAGCTTYAAKTGVTVRSQPSTFGSVVGSLSKGQTVCGNIVTSELKGGNYTACGGTSNRWVHFKGTYIAALCMTAIKGG